MLLVPLINTSKASAERLLVLQPQSLAARQPVMNAQVALPGCSVLLLLLCRVEFVKEPYGPVAIDSAGTQWRGEH